MTVGKSPHPDNRGTGEGKPGAVPGQPGPGWPNDEPAEPLPTIGRVLTEARRQARMTVDQVSTSTRIRVPIVYAVEADDFARCGGDFYARGHIRLIAREVGVDGDALVARYDAEHGGAPSEQPASQLLDSGRLRMTEVRRPSWTPAMVVAIVAVVALIGFNLVTGKAHQLPAGTASARLPSATASTGAAQGPGINAGGPIAAAPADKVTVKLVADKAASWVSAQDGNGKSLFQNNLDQGQDQTFTDPKQIKLVIGNAGAIHVYVNGKDLGPAGGDGQVVHLTYTPGDPQAG